MVVVVDVNGIGSSLQRSLHGGLNLARHELPHPLPEMIHLRRSGLSMGFKKAHPGNGFHVRINVDLQLLFSFRFLL